MELTETKFKQTELGLIPEDWEIRTLKDVGEVKMCRRIFSYQTKEQGDVPFYKIGTFGKKPDAFITKELYDLYRGKFSFPKVGDILISASGTIGRTVIYTGEDAYFQDSNIIWIDNNGKSISNDYLKYIYEVVKYRTEGGTIQRLYNNIIYDTSIICPPLPEQKAIVQILCDTDNLIQAIEQKLTKKRAIKQGAMQRLLTPKEDWEVKKLTEVVNYIHGKAHEKHIEEDGKYIAVNSKFISTEGKVAKRSNHNFCKARKGDVLTVLSDLPNGKALAKCFYVGEDDKYAVNQRICIWRSKSAIPMFLFYLLNRNNYFLKLDDGVTQTHILNHHIEKCEISIPNSTKEQTHIATILSDMDAEIAQLEQKLAKYQLVKQGLMQNLLTGKIRLV